jgi:hypothetical protein
MPVTQRLDGRSSHQLAQASFGRCALREIYSTLWLLQSSTQLIVQMLHRTFSATEKTHLAQVLQMQLTVPGTFWGEIYLGL